jgi:hypothetical protein
MPAMAYNPRTNKVLYHQTDGTGAPADWQYDPAADTWSFLTASGGGATSNQVMAFDAANNLMVGFNQIGFDAQVWQGSLTSAVPQPGLNACDLNGDGVVDSTDVQIAVNQSLGVSVCTNANLTGDRLCNVVDVQRIVQASLTGICRTGQ